MLTNEFRFIGTIMNEPEKQKIKDDKVQAKFVLKVVSKMGDTIVPCIAYNKKAHILCATAHKGSTIHCNGYVISKVVMTKTKASPLVSLAFRVVDFEVIDKEEVEEENYKDVIDLYDPDNFMEGGKEDVE